MQIRGDVLCVTLTSQVVGSSCGDGERRGGAHSRRLLAVYGQHGKVLLGDQAYGVPLTVVKARTWRGAEFNVKKHTSTVSLHNTHCYRFVSQVSFSRLISWNSRISNETLFHFFHIQDRVIYPGPSKQRNTSSVCDMSLLFYFVIQQFFPRNNCTPMIFPLR